MNKLPTINNKEYTLYGLYCPLTDEIKYIGITTRPLKVTLNTFNTYEELLLNEILEIQKHRNNNIKLLNIADGGDINPMLGKTHTIESRNKISNVQKGRKRTEIEKLKQKETLKKLWNDVEWSTKVRNKMIGNKNMV